jgi:hypothetical protein
MFCIKIGKHKQRLKAHDRGSVMPMNMAWSEAST